jgi:hypothetical protein
MVLFWVFKTCPPADGWCCWLPICLGFVFLLFFFR